MGRPIIDVTGKKFGQLLVLEKLNCRKLRSQLWRCECLQCGNKDFRCNITYLKKRIETNGSCNLCYGTGEFAANWTGYKEISGKYFTNVVKKAKERNLEFELSIEDLWNIYLYQDKKCNLTSEELYFSSNKIIGNASLDRKDPLKPYSFDNIQYVTCKVNRIKWIFNNEQFMNLCYCVSNKTKNIEKTRNSIINKDYYNGIMNDAKKRSMNFDITIEDLQDIFYKQNLLCKISGVNLNFSSYSKYRTASLSRIDCEKGYSIDNLQWVHKNINLSKGKMHSSEYINLCKSINLLNLNRHEEIEFDWHQMQHLKQVKY